MKAELKFKRTDNNQTPEVVTYHTDTIDVSGDDLRKLIQSVLGGYTTQTIVGRFGAEFINRFKHVFGTAVKYGFIPEF